METWIKFTFTIISITFCVVTAVSIHSRYITIDFTLMLLICYVILSILKLFRVFIRSSEEIILVLY